MRDESGERRCCFVFEWVTLLHVGPQGQPPQLQLLVTQGEEGHIHLLRGERRQRLVRKFKDDLQTQILTRLGRHCGEGESQRHAETCALQVTLHFPPGLQSPCSG